MNNQPSIVILDGYTVNPGDNPWAPVQALGPCTIYDRTPPELVLERAANAGIVLTNKVRIDAAILGQLPKLEYIGVLATGYNNVDVAEAGRLGIPVANVPGYSTESVAQTAFALLLELTNRVALHDGAVKEGEWIRCPDFSFLKASITELDGLTMGIVGFGAIGRAVARIGAAFGMQIVAYTPRIPQDSGPTPVRFLSLEELFATADVISLNCPQTAENTGFVNKSLLSVMKSSAFLINVARGGVINEADLAEALKAGVLAGAGVDVVAVEPMQADNPLLTAPNCIFTPHVAWASRAARGRLTGIVADNIRSYLAGIPTNVVNKAFLQVK